MTMELKGEWKTEFLGVRRHLGGRFIPVREIQHRV